MVEHLRMVASSIKLWLGSIESLRKWRPKAWVSVRLGLIAQMSPTVRRQLFAGSCGSLW
jgi:hypothetical protein